ncbi:MAG TPA: PAS domain S-box protein [Tepidisphaeraceae bacterium]|nr:PAS domain S-box protein [Tepidisphaeraceae bacterium]
MAQDTEPQKQVNAKASALTFAILYIVISGVWITASTPLMRFLFAQATPEQIELLEIAKGWLFIGVVAIVFYTLIYRQLTRLLASQEAIRLSEQRYRQLVETAEEGVWIIDAQRKTTFVNTKMAALLGYSVSEMLSQPLDRFTDADGIRLIMRDLGSSQGIRLQQDLRFRRKDGSDLWTILSRTPLFDEQGKPVGVLATITDITQRKETEAKYRALVEKSLVGVYIVQDYRFVYVNPRCAEIFGYTQQEIIDGKTVTDFIAPESHPFVIENLRKRLEGEALSVHYTFGMMRKDGSRIEVEVLGSQTTYNGRPAVIGSLMDITQRKQAERALQRSERRFRQLFERGADSLLLHDLDGRILDANQEACKSLGYSRDELLSLSISDIQVTHDLAQLRASWREALARGPMTLEATRRRKNGSCYPVEVRLGTFDTEDQPLILALVRDISDRKRAEEALRQSEMRFRSIYEKSPIGIGLYDVHGRLVDANSACLGIFGLSSMDDIRGHDLFVDPNSPPETLDVIRRGDQVSVEVAYDFEAIKTRGLYPTRRSGTIDLHALITPLRPSGDAQLSGYLILMQDITDRKRAEHALRFTQFAVDRAADGIFWLDDTGRFVYVNEVACRSLGYTRRELLSMRVHDIDTDFPPEVWHAHRETLRDRRFMVFESHHRASDGRIFPVELTSNILEFDGKEYTCSFARDIAERRRLEEDLRQSQKMEAVGRLAGGVAHDFNNLLAVIAGYSESLLRHLAADSPLRTHAEEIGRAADRGASLTRQLLAFGRRQVIKPQILDLNQIIRDLQDMLRRTITKTITIDYRLEADLGRIKADSGQMEQVLINLAINARDAMPDGGVLTISTQNTEVGQTQIAGCNLLPGQYVELSVRDTGCGMDPEVQTRIFEPFFTTKENKGTGLGLSIVYGIVQQAGGSIEVHSQPHQGTLFTILLPRVPDDLPSHS